MFGQQTYNYQHLQNNDLIQSNVERVEEGMFVGCIDFSITYSDAQNNQTEKVADAKFVIKETLKGYGDDRTICFNSNGDWLHVYNNGELVDSVSQSINIPIRVLLQYILPNNFIHSFNTIWSKRY